MLEAIQRSWFSNDFRLLWRGEPVAELDVSTLRTQAHFEFRGERYRCYRDGLLTGAFLLEQDGSVLARAEKPSMFRSHFTVQLAGRNYLLKKRSRWRRSFVLYESEREVGYLHRSGFFVRRVRVDFPEEWPLAAQAFIFWLALIVWTREDAAAAS
jgi:hypothetical protein